MAMRDDSSLADLIETAKKASPSAMAKIVAFARKAVLAEELRDRTAHQGWLDAAEPLEPYEWDDIDPTTIGEPVTYIEGVGAVVQGG